jgi:uncharacterized protein
MNRQVPDRLFRPGQGAEIVETHVSKIALDGGLVHKRRKPVHFAFVDLSTPERREQMCHREVELNRRFCADVYLGVENVVDDAGRVVDHAVLMRRMPADRRLAALVVEGRDVSACLRAVAHSLAACHAGAVTNEQVSAVATPEALHELWQGNLDEIAPFVPDPLDPSVVAEVGRLAHRYLDGRAALLSDRITAGRIVDGHGDLLADDIYCLPDGPRILDGLEFDDRLRWGDVLYDVGFLAMDLERLGRSDLAAAFLDWYREFSAETHPRSLEHHYVAYRALVRAKISCLKGHPQDRVDGRHYLAQCRRHLDAAKIQLVVVGGLPGVGKTTVAAALGERLGWPVLRSDEIRKQLAGLDPLSPAPAPYGEGLYAPAMSESTYAALFAQVGSLLRRGESVVVDASFSHVGSRAAAAVLAEECSADLTELCCALPRDEAIRRLQRRAESGGDASDATPSVAAAMATTFEPWPGAITVSTLAPPSEVLSTVLARLGAH